MFKFRRTSTLVDMQGDPICIGEWKREKELGSGGFGVVHLWVNKTKEDCLAIKKCRWNLESHLTQKQRERWTLEVDIMKGIKNENIVAYREMPEELKKTLMDYNTTNLPILSMEFCALGNLRNILALPESCCGLQELDVSFILKDISNALMYLHELNITHRDVKPENIVLQHCTNRPTSAIYKLIDLGYAKELDNETASFVGTLQYLAPEIFVKQKYTKTVDYWSFGIFAYEIICGMRPFLHTFTPWQSIGYLEKKPSNVISMQLSHTGEIKMHTGLVKENHLNICLCHLIEQWLRRVLEHDSEKRECNDGVFLTIQDILIKKIITIYSVYSYEFCSYEINESTLFSTLQGWIARDTKIAIDEQYIVSTSHSDSLYALDYYDEKNADAMLFVFRKNASICTTVSIFLPTLIKVLFENMKTEFKFGTLKQLYAQTVFLVLSETKHMNGLKSAISLQRDHLKNIFDKGTTLYSHLRNLLHIFFDEVEFYNYQETSLFIKVYEDTNYDDVKSCLEDFKCYMQQLVQTIDVVNQISIRQKVLFKKYYQTQMAFGDVFEVVENCDFSSLLSQACADMNQVALDNPVNNLSGSPNILKVVSATIKIRDKVLKNAQLLSYMRCANNCWKEIEKLNSALVALERNFTKIKNNLREIQTRKIKVLQDVWKTKANHTVPKVTFNGVDVLQENVSIRYKFQELMDTKFRKIPELDTK